MLRRTNPRNTGIAGFILTAMFAWPMFAMAQAKSTQPKPNLELRLQPGQLINGIPESFTFVFVNISSDEIRMPLPSKCIGSDNGTLLLSIEFTAPGTSGFGGGCGGGINGPKIPEKFKNWEILEPNKSLSISYSRQELFATQQAPGRYEFWAEYRPPEISADDQRALTEAGIDFPREQLVSRHLVFVRKP